jgi:hypothetical protein
VPTPRQGVESASKISGAYAGAQLRGGMKRTERLQRPAQRLPGGTCNRFRPPIRYVSKASWSALLECTRAQPPRFRGSAHPRRVELFPGSFRAIVRGSGGCGGRSSAPVAGVTTVLDPTASSDSWAGASSTRPPAGLNPAAIARSRISASASARRCSGVASGTLPRYNASLARLDHAHEQRSFGASVPRTRYCRSRQETPRGSATRAVALRRRSRLPHGDAAKTRAARGRRHSSTARARAAPPRAHGPQRE